MPSGVSYVLENREVMTRLFPRLFEAASASARSTTTRDLLLEHAARASRPGRRRRPHGRGADARRLQLRLLRARLPRPADGRRAGRGARPRGRGRHASTCARRAGLQRVDVIYRRIDDDFLDPLVFRPDSMLGVPGLMSARTARGTVDARQRHRHRRRRRQGDLPLRARDMIRYYLGEEPILPNVPTYTACESPTSCAYVLAHLDKLVVKAANESGGYGMLIGPAGDRRASSTSFAKRIEADPRDVHRAADARAARPHPTCRSARSHGAAPHRPAARSSSPARRVEVVPGGLTRVALREGSLVVNSSQGGGTKDTWVLASGRLMLARVAEDLLLDRPLPRARREHRAPARRDLPHVADAVPSPGAGARVGGAVVGAPDHHGHSPPRTTSSTPRPPPAEVLRYMVLRPGQPLLDLQLRCGRARESHARCAARSPPRCGRCSTHLARDAALRRASYDGARAASGLLRLGEGPVATCSAA